jgi:signal transduction histidine kinase
LVDVSMSRGVLSIEVIDDGRGFEATALNKPWSFGVRGMRERAEQHGGWIDAMSDPSGTTMLLSIPVQSGRDPASTVAGLLDDPSGWGQG